MVHRNLSHLECKPQLVLAACISLMTQPTLAQLACPGQSPPVTRPDQCATQQAPVAGSAMNLQAPLESCNTFEHLPSGQMECCGPRGMPLRSGDNPATSLAFGGVTVVDQGILPLGANFNFDLLDMQALHVPWEGKFALQYATVGLYRQAMISNEVQPDPGKRVVFLTVDFGPSTRHVSWFGTYSYDFAAGLPHPVSGAIARGAAKSTAHSVAEPLSRWMLHIRSVGQLTGTDGSIQSVSVHSLCPIQIRRITLPPPVFQPAIQ